MDAQQIVAVKQANGQASLKPLQIGIGREVPAAAMAKSDALIWVGVKGGIAARWVVESQGARAMRIGLEATGLAAGQQLRFRGADGIVYGPFGPAEVGAMGPVFWSPVLEGESAVVEFFVPGDALPPTTTVAITQLSHFFVSPTVANIDFLAKIGESQSCERDLICLSAFDTALATVGKAVARMTFTNGANSYLCTGTLLTTTNTSFIPYFYSAAHCMSSQAIASTLTTHWFYDRTACGSGVQGGTYTQVAGGATLLHRNIASDALLLRLNNAPPAGSVFAGWSAATLSATGTTLTGVHHPAGDVKKVSLGTSGGFATTSLAPGGSFLFVNWNSSATGVTEGGSSGSGIFTNTGAGYQLRGGLLGGASYCGAPTSALNDYYSRFDQVYAQVSTWLAPALSDVSLVMSIPSTAQVGKDIVFTGTIANAGPAATQVILRNIVGGANVIWTSASGCYDVGINNFTCTFANVPSGASIAFKVVARATTLHIGLVQSQFWTITGTPDPVPANNGMTTYANTTLTNPPAATAINRYRLYSPVTLEHHFTTDLNEYNTLGTYVGTWVKEGTVGKVLNNPGTFNGVTAVPYYRLYNTATAWHHWTTDVNEYYTLGLFPGWVLEGVDGYLLPTNTTGATQLYRLLYPFVAGLHHWTIDANEYSTLIGTYGWIGEGGSGYVVQ